MPVVGAKSVTLEVPDLEPGVRFYSDAGLAVAREGNLARCRCPGVSAEAIVLVGGAPRKRLHHLCLRADNLEEIARLVPGAGGALIAGRRTLDP